MKHILTQHHKLKGEYFGSKEQEIIQRILKRGYRLKVSGFILLYRLVGRGKHLSYSFTIMKKTKLSILLYLGNLAGAQQPRQTKNILSDYRNRRLSSLMTLR
jgi:hypothetical protein